MHEKDNYPKTADLSTEQNQNIIDGVPNNTPLPPESLELDKKPLDKVKESKERRKGRPHAECPSPYDGHGGRAVRHPCADGRKRQIFLQIS